MIQPTTFSQRDPRWFNNMLGTSKELTIGQAGCLITSIASALVDCGVPTDPDRLNKWLTTCNGYAEDDLLVWASLEGIGLHLVDLIDCERVSAPLDKIAQALDYDQFVITEVIVGAHTENPTSHYMRLYAMQQRGGWVIDPWRMPGSEMVGLERYISNPAVGFVGVAIYESRHSTRMWPLPGLDETALHQERICLYRED